MKKISIIIPAYNEEKFIKETLKRVIKANTLGLTKEIIIINDGSTDKTLHVLKKIKKDKRVKIISNNKNQGKGSAIKKGLLLSNGNIVIIQDADLEYDPKDYVLLIAPFLEKKADVVYGSRFISGQPHRVLYFWHYVVNIFLTGLSNILTNLNLTDMETGYKAFKGNIIRSIAPNLESKRFGFESEITAKIAKIKNIRIYEVGISYQGRIYEEGKKINWIDGLKNLIDIILFNLFR